MENLTLAEKCIFEPIQIRYSGAIDVFNTNTIFNRHFLQSNNWTVHVSFNSNHMNILVNSLQCPVELYRHTTDKLEIENKKRRGWEKYENYGKY